MMLLLDFLHVFYFYHFFFESLWALPLFQLHYSLSSFLLSVFCTEFSSVYFPLRSFPLYLHFWDRFAFFLLFPPWVLTAHVSPPLAILSSFPEFLFLLCSWLFVFFFFHRNDCFIGFFIFMVKYFTAIIFISSLHLPGNVPYLGYFLWLLLIFFHCRIFASILPILSISYFSFTTYCCMSGLSLTSCFAGSPWGTDRRTRVTLHYF